MSTVLEVRVDGHVVAWVSPHLTLRGRVAARTVTSTLSAARTGLRSRLVEDS